MKGHTMTCVTCGATLPNGTNPECFECRLRASLKALPPLPTAPPTRKANNLDEGDPLPADAYSSLASPPALLGTPKQCSYAAAIRDEWITKMSHRASSLGTQDVRDEALFAVGAVLLSRTRASWWIDYKPQLSAGYIPGWIVLCMRPALGGGNWHGPFTTRKDADRAPVSFQNNSVFLGSVLHLGLFPSTWFKTASDTTLVV